jgi:arylsulfatase A-like enzyme
MGWSFLAVWALFTSALLALGQTLADLGLHLEGLPSALWLPVLPLFNFGLAALPVLLALGLLRLLSLPFPWADPRRAGALFAHLSQPARAFELLALLTSRGLALLVFVGGGLGLQLVAAKAFNHELLRAALVAVLLAALGLLLLGLARVLGAGLTARLWPKVRHLPGTLWLSLPPLGLLLVLLPTLWLFRDTLALLGWEKVLWVLVAPLALALSFAAALRWRPPALPLFIILVLAPGAAILPGFSRDFMATNPASEGPLSAVLELYKGLGDFDGDGASALFSDGDCAPFDAGIGPFAMEIPGNGIDDNCVGGDASPVRQRAENTWGLLPAGFPQTPDLVLITVDALRADHTGFLGYGRPTTPALDQWVKSGVVFERAYSQGTGTISSMPSVLSGRYPYQLLYEDHGNPPRISDSNRMLAEILNEDGGYATSAVSTIIYTRQNLWNLLQGFRSVDSDLATPDPAYRITSPQVLEKATEALANLDAGPGFLWVHFYDVHSSYMKHPDVEGFGDDLEGLYDAELAYTDRYIGQFLDQVFERAKTRPTVVILTADHGEGFPSDRGRKTHAYGLFGELLHVPLVLWAPGLTPGSVDSPVGNIDIAATLLHAAGLAEPGLPGRSLLDYAGGLRDDQRYIFSEKTFGGSKGLGGRIHKSATGKRWKYIYQFTEGREQLFDLDKDPREKSDVATQHRQMATKLRALLLDFMEQTSMALYEERVSPFVLDKLPAEVPACKATFGGGSLKCVGVRHALKRDGRRGQVLQVELFLKVVKKLPKDYRLQLVLRDPKGRVITKKVAWPLGGLLPSSRWTPGKVYLERFELPLKAGAKGPVGSLWLSFKAADGKLLPAVGKPPKTWKSHGQVLNLAPVQP